MARTRWGADTPEDATDARRRLVDAGQSSFERYGIAKTTVEDVAEAAKVGARAVRCTARPSTPSSG